MFACTLNDLIPEQLERRGDHPALEDGDAVATYADLHARIEALAGWLHHLGVRRGDRVAVHVRKSIDEVVAMFAAMRVGAAFVNVPAQRTADQLLYAINDAEAIALVAEPRRAAELADAGLPDCVRFVLVRGDAPDHPAMHALADCPADARAPHVTVIDVDLACIMYTSGSTGQPKGVMLTHRNWMGASAALGARFPNRPEDRMLGLNPLGFSLALDQMLCMFRAGATYVLHHVMLPDQIAAAIHERRITAVHTTPVLWVPLVRYLQERPQRFAHLRYIANGGGALPRPILEALGEVFPGVDLHLGFGITEVVTCTALPPHLFREKMGAIGVAQGNIELFVVDPDTGLAEPGGTGELIQRGSLLSPGYWRRPEATAERFKPNPHLRHLIGDEIVYHSGDTVRIDEDGVLWFLGRNDAMIKTGGIRISPDEIEGRLHRHPAVAECAAWGVKDDALGQAVHVAVFGEGIDAGELLTWCRAELPAEMVPAACFVTGAPLAKSPNGKLDRRAVAAECGGED